MTSPFLEHAVSDAAQYGKAILKFISPNDVGSTGSHQCGYYLPKNIWRAFSPYPPDKGKNYEHLVKILWQDGRITKSCIKWYGKGTRSEYRLTRFGRDFPFLTADNIGDLLVLIPTGTDTFTAYVLDREEDIEGIEAAFDVELIDTWAFYDAASPSSYESEDDCINRHFREFCKDLEEFPATTSFSIQARTALLDCIAGFRSEKPDYQLMECMDAEYKLFRLVERFLCQNEITRLFKSIDDFLSTAARIMNRRKARAGRALENHVEFILRDYDIPFDVRPEVDGEPDVIIPGKVQYEDLAYPTSKLFIIGIKTTCKDRWRQVLNEAKRIPHKHILTIQQGISANQLKEMHKSKVSLIVPEQIQKQYPMGTEIKMVSLETFINDVQTALAR